MQQLTATQLKHLRSLLEEQQQSLQQKDVNNDSYGLDESMRDGIGELSLIDNHPADVATELYYREMDLMLQDHDDHRLTHISEALERMDQGTYGVCRECGKPISYARLEAVPTTAYCIEHSPKQNVSNYPPVEEEFLMPPFGRTSLDEREDQNGFDGEDTWQVLENFGSSNTPAMADSNEIHSYDDMEIEASDELEGFVEPLEAFVATDIYGNLIDIVRSQEYRRYMDKGEFIDMQQLAEEDDDDEFFDL
ncbi:TraR/DksA C4-type zinc finger protein [Paenibacillus sp. KQZ6P-2]|uniref:TraR/DksA C4-type zinc finger protein n=1 Tax=Paenibacillus mangrovi TaxID=2931978 RepID=A0A9X1WMG7_9BACL|nr:TraR/DksA C4-type zinc finger protein [Paenibacillus mangrovi]MCJ8011346.1 TraR/DksA C4-type zinc finger protein [Paenibacillus mangrovi]